MRLMRNIDELRKAKLRPYGSSSLIEQLEEKIAKDKANDPQRPIARGALDRTFALEVDPMYGLSRSGMSRIDADIENEFTAKRVASGKTARLLDMPTERFPVSFRPASKEQKKQARIKYKQARELEIAVKNFLNDVMRDSGTGMGVPYNVKVGRKMPGMLAGMEDTGLPMGSNQRASAIKSAIANLEVDSLGIANPADELTRVSVAEGRSNLLGKINVNLPYNVMPVTPPGDFLIFPRAKRLPKGVEGPVDDPRGNAFRREQEIERMRRKSIFQMYEDERFFKMSHSALDPFVPNGTQRVLDPRFVDRLPPMMEGMDYTDKMYMPDVKKITDYTTTIDYTQRYQGSIVAQKNQQKAIARAQSEAAAAARQSRVSSSMADNIAQDTMRAASVIHSSKLGFAAVGAGAIGAAFGISSLRNKKEQRRTELERR